MTWMTINLAHSTVSKLHSPEAGNPSLPKLTDVNGAAHHQHHQIETVRPSPFENLHRRASIDLTHRDLVRNPSQTRSYHPPGTQADDSGTDKATASQKQKPTIAEMWKPLPLGNKTGDDGAPPPSETGEPLKLTKKTKTREEESLNRKQTGPTVAVEAYSADRRYFSCLRSRKKSWKETFFQQDTCDLNGKELPHGTNKITNEKPTLSLSFVPKLYYEKVVRKPLHDLQRTFVEQEPHIFPLNKHALILYPLYASACMIFIDIFPTHTKKGKLYRNGSSLLMIKLIILSTIFSNDLYPGKIVQGYFRTAKMTKCFLLHVHV
ncbi:LOW QUALITY PROTEIN: hypothetical protein YC2023_088628 [Brassica napus]